MGKLLRRLTGEEEGISMIRRKVMAALATAAIAVAAALGGVASTPAHAAPQPVGPAEVSTAALKPPSAPPKITSTNSTKPKGVKGNKGAPLTTGGVTTQARTTGPSYHYVGGSHTTANNGGYANVTVNWPYSDLWASDNGAHSLVEIDAENPSGASGTRQIVEVGINSDTGLYPGTNDNPHFFVFWWKNGIGQCYNGCGYVDYTGPNNCTYHPGAAMDALVGTATSIGIEHTTNVGSPGWWISQGGKWCGYYPDSLWTAPTFTAATKTQWFFEVYSAYNEPCSDMGDGAQGSGGAGAVPRPAYISSASFPTGTPTVSMTNYVTPVSGKFTQSVASGRTFYGGGPGWNAAGTATGTPGAC